MPVRWTIDNERWFVHVVCEGAALEHEYVEMIRETAKVTNLSGGYGILIDARALTDVPGYAETVRICREVWNHRSPTHDYIAILIPQTSLLYGKARQVVAVMTTLGLVADLFESESEAHRWMFGWRTPIVAP